VTEQLLQEPDMSWPPAPFLPPPPPRTADDGTRRFDELTYARTPGYRPRLLDVHVPAVPAAPTVSAVQAAPGALSASAGAPTVPAVLWIHGGGWLDGDRRFPPPTVPAELLFGSILAAGMAVVRIDYRHSLESPFPAQLHDVKAALRYVRHHAATFGIDPERIGVWGESAGGHLAALAGLTSPDTDGGSGRFEGAEGVTTGGTAVRAVVDWYGVSDINAAAAAFPSLTDLPGLPGAEGIELPAMPDPYSALLGASPAERPDLAAAASPVSHTMPAAPPFLLVHGTEDNLVPYAQSESLAEHLRAQAVPVELVPVTGADHIFLGSPDIAAIVARSVEFLARHL
jgi:acetyl esterase/lipase